MDYAVTAREILERVGGERNVASATHCMTRLRLVLKDKSGVDDEKIKSIPGVVGVMRKSGQYQIIIGNNVAKCFAEFNKLGNFADESASGSKKAKGKRKINPVSAVLDAISGSIAPIIPAIIGAGMIRVLYIILNFWIPAENSTMTVLNAIADAAFYFLPILIAFSAGKKFGANPYLAAAVVGVLIHPNIIAAVTNATDEWATFLGIPLLNTSYSSTVLPALLTAYAMSWIEKGVDKITPAITKNFLKPMLIILISALVALIIPYGDPTYTSFTDVKELPAHIFDELRHFFSVYKQLEGKDTVVTSIGGPLEAVSVIERSMENYIAKFPEAEK